MMRISITLLFLGTLWQFTLAQESAFVRESVDTLLVDQAGADAIYVRHSVRKGETLYAISRMYGLTAPDLVLHNATLADRPLGVNDTLDIPIPRASLIFNKSRTSPGLRPVYYQVKPGETVFRISRIYFEMPMAQLIQRNSLPHMDLSVGQVLHIGWLDNKGLALQQIKDHTPYLPDSGKTEAQHSIDTLYDFSEMIVRQGVAYWNKEYPGNNQYFAMHASARVSSYIEITNPMFGRSVVAKVVGRIPPNRFPADINVIVSPKVANDLGAIDGRFFVKMRYVPED